MGGGVGFVGHLKDRGRQGGFWATEWSDKIYFLKESSWKPCWQQREEGGHRRPNQRLQAGPGGQGWHGTDETWSDCVCVLNFIINEKVVIERARNEGCMWRFWPEQLQGAASITRDEKGWGGGGWWWVGARKWGALSWSSLDWKLLGRRRALALSVLAVSFGTQELSITDRWTLFQKLFWSQRIPVLGRHWMTSGDCSGQICPSAAGPAGHFASSSSPKGSVTGLLWSGVVCWGFDFGWVNLLSHQDIW